MERLFKLSKYQQDIVDFINYNNGNLLVDAKAGSGKTSTLIIISDEITKKGNKCLFLSFNKHIVDELNEKINNPNCLVKTVHSLGYTFIKSYLFKKHGTHYTLEISTDKLKNLVRDYYDKNFRGRLDLYNATGKWLEEDLKFSGEECNTNADDESLFVANKKDIPLNLSNKELRELHNDIISEFANLCNFSRLYNLNYKAVGELDDLVEKFCWKLSEYVEDGFPDYQDLIIEVLDSTKKFFENPEIGIEGEPVYKIDYVDMLYFPVLYNMSIPYSIKDYIGTILVDEAQDLSILQQKFINKLNNGFNRFIFVRR